MRTVVRTRPGAWLARLSAFPLAILLFAPLVTANAEQAKKMHRIGVLSELAPTAGATGGPRPLFGEDTWRTAFRHRGYVEGQNVLFEFRHAGERFERLPELAEDLVRAKVDVIIAVTTPTALAAKRVTGNIPIIAVSADPISANLVASLARPGGNVTGLFVPWPDLSAKGLQLLRDAVPDLDKVAILWNPLNQTAHVGSQSVENAAKTMGIGTQRIEMRRQEDLDQISKMITATRVRGLIVVLDLVTVRAAPSIAQLAAKHRLPGFHAYREFAEAGGLMSYGDAAARTLGIQLQSVEVRDARLLEPAFAAMTKEKAKALIVLSDSMIFGQRIRIADLAVRHRLPAIAWTPEFVEGGRLLMVYGPNVAEMHRRAAAYVDKILRGVSPADLPVEQPTKFELAINLTTAKTLGLTIPPSLLQRADRVVQ